MLLIPIYAVQAQNYFEYHVQIRADGSAFWTITQFSNVNSTVDTFNDFQLKVFDLVDSAAEINHREMSVNENSLQINTTISTMSKITEFTFVWQNFSIVQGEKISFGDVFQVPNFFEHLYGDAALQISYPSNFLVQSVSPAPYQRQDSAGILKWSRTQDLATDLVTIILENNSHNEKNISYNWQLYGGVVAASIGVVVGSWFVFYRFRVRKNNQSASNFASSPILTEKEKILKLIKTSGGSMRQSKITNQLGFSKAKTSQLLTALEKDDYITRYKNGRDKIVTLKEGAK